MSVGDSPAVARRRVSVALRAARQERRLTQGQVARELDWSLSKVQRIETGDVSVSTTDLRSLLEYLNITDDDTVKQLMESARISRRQRWFTEPKYRQHLTPATRQMLQFENEARVIRAFHPAALPGLLQTAPYARAIFDSKPGVLSEEAQDVRYEVRMRRRQVLSREDPPEYLLLLDESVLWREFGGAEIVAEQLVDLLVVAREPRVHVRVLTFAQASVVALFGPFTLFDLGEAGTTILYTERYDEDEIIQRTQEVQKHRDVFEALWSKSLGETASERLILARAATLMSSLDRRDFP